MAAAPRRPSRSSPASGSAYEPPALWLRRRGHLTGALIESRARSSRGTFLLPFATILIIIIIVVGERGGEQYVRGYGTEFIFYIYMYVRMYYVQRFGGTSTRAYTRTQARFGSVLILIIRSKLVLAGIGR